MASSTERTNLARAQAQDVLKRIPQFHEMSWDDKLKMYRALVDDHLQKMSAANGGEMAAAMAEPQKASDLINDSRFTNSRIDTVGNTGASFIQQVDFPTFVKDLLKGVFDANLKVSIQQTEEYQKLLKTATKSVAEFVNAIDDTAAFGYLAENQADKFSLDFDTKEADAAGNPKAVLTNAKGERLDLGDNEIKAKIMDAKISMAKEQRNLLVQLVVAGIQRLVVDSGKVKASVLFDVKASESIDRQDKAALKQAHSSGTSLKKGGGLIGSLFGGSAGGNTSSDTKTQISVSSAKGLSSTSLEAKLTGEVEILFKSDYFKLDNFAATFTGATPADRAALQGAAPGTAPLSPVAGRPPRE